MERSTWSYTGNFYCHENRLVRLSLANSKELRKSPVLAKDRHDDAVRRAILIKKAESALRLAVRADFLWCLTTTLLTARKCLHCDELALAG